MKKEYFKKLLIITLTFSLFPLFAQDDDLKLKLHSGEYNLKNNINSFIKSPSYSSDELYQESYFRIIQFENTPDSKDRAELKSAGIDLFDYLPDQAYFAQIKTDADLQKLSDKSARSIVEVKKEFKLTATLTDRKFPDWALFGGNKIGITAFYYSTIDRSHVLSELEALDAEVTHETGVQIISFKIPIPKLDKLYDLNSFYFFEAFEKPGEPEGHGDVSNHRSNFVKNPVGVGTSYNGDGVSIMMQDDGPIGPHIDYEGRLTEETTSNFGDHGDHVAGIIMGAGNLDPTGVGNAPGAHLHVYSSSNSNYSVVPSLYENEGVVITSKSYGNGANAGYTGLASQLDEQCWNYSALVHVFSAGNSGTSDAGYGAGPGWGNITGGHKQGKNVLAVGNLSESDFLSSSSSRGPASDGRIKPDICAVGTGVYSTVDSYDYENKTGTSMACPGVAGSLALLYEAYRDLNGGQDPSAALINAATLNTAKDLGNPGPDFKHGWGRINTKKAYEIIADENYQNGTVDDGQANTHSVDVPSGTKQLRLMVYWTDYPGSPVASEALVNDINMTVEAPSGTVYEPWVLDPTPNPALLDDDAVRGVDDLNNVEQVTVDDPEAGTHIVNIDGFNIPEGPQEYYIVYEFVEDEIEIIYPVGGESFVPSQTELIRWDAYGDNGSFTIEYTLDDGQNWDNISSSIPGSWRSFTWLTPSTVTGQARVRVSRNGISAESKENFTIIPQPTGIDFEWACPQSFNVSWNPVSGATGYEVSLLGDKYMDSVAYTTNTNVTIYANSLETHWVSVKAYGPNGAVGRRAIAVQKTPGTFGCTLDPPVADFTALCTEVGPGSCIKYIDVSTNAGQGAAWEWYCPGGSPETSTLEQPVICYENEGTYDVQLIVKNGVGQDTLSYSQFVNIRKGEALPFEESFESGLVPENWQMENSGNNMNWSIDTKSSGYEIGNHSIMIDNFNMDSAGSTNRFWTQQIDLSENEMIYALNFDLAYANTLDRHDTLAVYATNDCGNTLNLIYLSGGYELATAPPTSSMFVPNENEWRSEVVSLDTLKGSTSVSFVFENRSENGNVIYVDNLNVNFAAENFSNDVITIFPNPVDDQLNIAGILADENVKIRVSSPNGRLIYEYDFVANGAVLQLNTSGLASGVYVIHIETDSKTFTEKFVKAKE